MIQKIAKTRRQTTILRETSDDYLEWPSAVEFARKSGVLASAKEIAYFQTTGKLKTGEKYFATRTGAFYFKEGSEWYAAFDDERNESKNLILSQVDSLRDEELRRGNVIRSRKNNIEQMINRAEKSGRILRIKEGKVVKHSTVQKEGTSEYGAQILPLLQEVSEIYVSNLNKKGIADGCLWLLTSEQLEKQNLEDKVLIRAVGIRPAEGLISAVNQLFYPGIAQSISYSTPKSSI